MKVQFTLLFFSGLILYRCSSKQDDLIGTWSVKNYNLFELAQGFINGARGYEQGRKLILKSDFTYTDKNCGNITTGKWVHKGDSLVLNSDTTWNLKALWYMKNYDPSYDSIAGRLFRKRLTFFISGDKLLRYSKSYKYLKDSAGHINLDKKSHSFLVILKRESTD